MPNNAGSARSGCRRPRKRGAGARAPGGSWCRPSIEPKRSTATDRRDRCRADPGRSSHACSTPYAHAGFGARHATGGSAGTNTAWRRLDCDVAAPGLDEWSRRAVQSAPRDQLRAVELAELFAAIADAPRAATIHRDQEQGVSAERAIREHESNCARAPVDVKNELPRVARALFRKRDRPTRVTRASGKQPIRLSQSLRVLRPRPWIGPSRVRVETRRIRPARQPRETRSASSAAIRTRIGSSRDSRRA